MKKAQDDKGMILKRLQDIYELLLDRGFYLKSFNSLFTSVGMAYSNASAYATGKKRPGEETLKKLQSKYGINPDYVLYGEGDPLISVLEEPANEYQMKISSDKMAYYESELKNREELIEALRQVISEKERVIKLLEKNSN